MICCKRNKCFKVWNFFCLFKKGGTILDQDTDGRFQSLAAVLGSDRLVQFDGRTVFCSSCLRHSSSPGLWKALSRIYQQECSPVMELEIYPRALTTQKRDAMICFLNTTAESTAEMMPDRCERHLPFFSKIKVHLVFTIEFLNVLVPNPSFTILFLETRA